MRTGHLGGVPFDLLLVQLSTDLLALSVIAGLLSAMCRAVSAVLCSVLLQCCKPLHLYAQALC